MPAPEPAGRRRLIPVMVGIVLLVVWCVWRTEGLVAARAWEQAADAGAIAAEAAAGRGRPARDLLQLARFDLDRRFPPRLTVARERTSNALRKAPLRGDSWLLLARIELTAGRTKEAAAALDMADRLDPGTPQYRVEAIRLRHLLGRVDEATAAAAELVALDGALLPEVVRQLAAVGYDGAAILTLLAAKQGTDGDLPGRVLETLLRLDLASGALDVLDEVALSNARTRHVAMRIALEEGNSRMIRLAMDAEDLPTQETEGLLWVEPTITRGALRPGGLPFGWQQPRQENPVLLSLLQADFSTTGSLALRPTAAATPAFRWPAYIFHVKQNCEVEIIADMELAGGRGDIAWLTLRGNGTAPRSATVEAGRRERLVIRAGLARGQHTIELEGRCRDADGVELLLHGLSLGEVTP